MRGARLDPRPGRGVRRRRRAHVVRRHPRRRRTVARARHRHRPAPARRRARRPGAARLDPLQPPPLGPHPGPAVPAQRRPRRRRRRCLGAGRRRTATTPLEVLSRVMSPPHFPITPDQLRGTWTFEAMVPGRRQHRRRRRADARHRPQGRPHVRTPARGRRRQPGLHARPLPVDRRRRPGRRDARARRGCRRAGPRRRVHRRRAADTPSASVTPSSTTSSTSPVAGSVRKVVLVHHAPARTDEEIVTIERRLADAPIPVVIGREGMWVDTASGDG